MRFAVFLPLIAFFLAGCAGYHLGPVKPKYMTGISTVAVPSFKNDTLRARVEVLLANALIKQIQQDGTYKVTDGNDADVVIKGTLQQVTRSPSRSVFGNVLLTEEYNLILRCRFQVFKRATGVLLDEREVQGQTTFFVNGSENIAADVNSQERQALPLAAEDLMVRYVSLLSEGW
jgi:outer membrane lipopolysaccharide assembly protein LptE/RlpB